jgi:1,2-phenylacetyl-CoA epoxidase PaaB subunit
MANLMDVAMAAVVSGLPGQGADGEKCEAYIWNMRDRLPRTREWSVTLATGETIAVPHTSDTLWDLLLRTETPHSIVAVTEALRSATPEEQLAAAQALQNAAADTYRREQVKKELAKFPDLAAKLTNAEAKGIIEKLR